MIIPTLHAQEVEDRTHPLRVAPGQVVVDGDDVDAAPGQRVEDRRQRRDEGLALAGPHLGDLALVEDGAAHELDVEVAHAERPLHGLAGHREDLGQDVVEGLLEPLVLALVRRSLVSSRRRSRSGWWSSSSDGSSGTARLVDLRAELGEGRADLLVGQGLVFGFEGVGRVDQGLEPSDLAVVRVDEPGKELHGR